MKYFFLIVALLSFLMVNEASAKRRLPPCRYPFVKTNCEPSVLRGRSGGGIDADTNRNLFSVLFGSRSVGPSGVGVQRYSPCLSSQEPATQSDSQSNQNTNSEQGNALKCARGFVSEDVPGCDSNDPYNKYACKRCVPV